MKLLVIKTLEDEVVPTLEVSRILKNLKEQLPIWYITPINFLKQIPSQKSETLPLYTNLLNH
jgi:hypothetical protein